MNAQISPDQPKQDQTEPAAAQAEARPVPPVETGGSVPEQVDAKQHRDNRLSLALAMGGMAMLLAVGNWLDTRQELDHLRLEAGSFNKESRNIAEKSSESLRGLQTQLAVLQSKANESQNQQLALEAMYQELSRSRDEASLAEVEQTLSVASQQLQLAGNVRAALVALQNIDNRLAGHDKPQWITLRAAINRDIETLKRFPFVDTVGISVKLNSLVLAVDDLPLVVSEPSRPAKPAVNAQKKTQESLLPRLGNELWLELKDLVRVRRIDGQEPLLLSPEQAFFLRENLKLRLLDARMANLQRDGVTFRSDIIAAQRYAQRYFDAASPATKAFSASLSQLAAIQINVEPPTLSASLNAVREARPLKEGGLH